ncbi:hypothetical protein M9435_004491 [Picochlorum sp. BPE23]|nr:hypothetical protein M9435_004491 [Picochlorum sp. BPE23]
MASLQGLASNLIGNVASQNYATFQQSIQRRPKTSRSSDPKLWRLPPVCVTNEGKEVRVRKLIDERGIDDDNDYIIVDPENPVPNPELGPLERRVSVTFEEGLALDTVDKEAMEYWFTEPPQGWSTEKRILKKVQGFPVDENMDEFRHEGGDRKPLSNLQIGDVLTGTVVAQLMNHGLRVDIGAEADGLVPMRGIDIWKKVEQQGKLPDVGDSIEVEVFAIREDPVFRFPLQVAPLDEDLASNIPPPEEHKPPLDLRDVPLSRYDEVAKLSGRFWGTQKVLVTPADLDDFAAGSDDFEISEEDMELFDSIVAELDL